MRTKKIKNARQRFSFNRATIAATAVSLAGFAGVTVANAKIVTLLCDQCIVTLDSLAILYGDPVNCRGVGGLVGCIATPMDSNGDGQFDIVENTCNNGVEVPD